MCFLFKNYSLVEVVYLLIRFNTTKFFLWNTNNTDRNGVNKQNTHTHTHTKHLEEENKEKGRGPTTTLVASYFLLIFDSA